MSIAWNLLLAVVGTAIVWKSSERLEGASQQIATHYGLPEIVKGAVLTAVASTVLTSVGGFFGAGIAVTLIQRRAGADGWLKSLAKGLVAGVVVGVPFPVIGTFVGGVVLAVSVLDFLKKLEKKAGGG